MITAGECFKRLKNHLEETGLMPDEYFSLSWNIYEHMELPEYKRAVCSANWGGSEGIYLDVSLEYIEDSELKSMRMMVGKTLGTSGEDYMIMSRVAAECSLMLNGEGYIYKVPEESYQFSFMKREEGKEKESEKQEKRALKEGVILSCIYETKYGVNSYASLHPDSETACRYIEDVMKEANYDEANAGEYFNSDITTILFDPDQFPDYKGKIKALDNMIRAADGKRKMYDEYQGERMESIAIQR